jgi:hypothetical protein|tara:strand:- start:1346 stop:1564 length:219 start_codon:yes stop_codon:yes gene_type:complete
VQNGTTRRTKCRCTYGSYNACRFDTVDTIELRSAKPADFVRICGRVAENDFMQASALIARSTVPLKEEVTTR